MDRPSVTIKELTESDLPAGADIIRRAFATVAAEFGLTKENCPTNGAFIDADRLLDEYRRGIKMFGLFGEDRQLGFVALERKDEDTFFLEKLAVLPEFRHNRYGGMLMDCAKEYVAQAGGKNISIGIILENQRLLQWYKTLEFVETGTKKFDHLPFTVCFLRLAV